jgi:hypothetical protein
MSHLLHPGNVDIDIADIMPLLLSTLHHTLQVDAKIMFFGWTEKADCINCLCYVWYLFWYMK